MSAGTAGPARSLVLRQPNTMLAPAAVWLFCVGAVADAVIEGTVEYAVHVVVLMAAIALAAWMMLASPCLVVEADGLRVVNPIRVRWIPFAAVDAVRVRGLTSVVARTASGGLRTVTSWNAPGQPRRHGTPALTGEAIERSRAAWEARVGGDPGPDALVTTWRWRPGLALALLVAANIAIWFR